MKIMIDGEDIPEVGETDENGVFQVSRGDSHGWWAYMADPEHEVTGGATNPNYKSGPGTTRWFLD